jgi:hypothetical protein
MARCAADQCGRWRPEVLVRRGVGTFVDGMWFCSRGCIEQMARRRLIGARPVAAGIPSVPPMRLGALLRHHGVCGADAIEQALQAQRDSRLKLGEQLFAMGAAEPRSVLRALAAQAGVGYLADVDAGAVRDAPGGLSPDAVRALGVVPISEVEDGRIRVACKAPVPRRAISAFRRLTAWIPETYLVSDDNFDVLLRNYGRDVEGDRSARSLTEFSQTESLADAAARIAEAATRAGDTSLTEARFEPYTWIRIQGDGLVEDVLFASRARTEEEAPCLAAITSH